MANFIKVNNILVEAYKKRAREDMNRQLFNIGSSVSYTVDKNGGWTPVKYHKTLQERMQELKDYA